MLHLLSDLSLSQRGEREHTGGDSVKEGIFLKPGPRLEPHSGCPRTSILSGASSSMVGKQHYALNRTVWHHRKQTAFSLTAACAL